MLWLEPARGANPRSSAVPWTLLLVAMLVATGPAAAQTTVTTAAIEPMDTSSLGTGPYSRMSTLLEKTIFKVDVLTLEVWLGAEDTRQLEGLVEGRRRTDALADSIAEVAIHSKDALVSSRFERGVSLDQFLGGIDDNLRLVMSAGLISDADYERITEELPRWYAFLAERGIHDGDRQRYRIRGDSLRTQYWAASGELLLDQTDVGASARLAVLGGYYVRGSDFRKGLIKSLFPND